MNYAIYGINRVAKDFLYIFDDLDIECFVDINPTVSSFMGYPAIRLQDFLTQRRTDCKVIICSFDHTAEENLLKESGLKRQRDYVFEEDFFEKLDNNYSFNPDKKPVAVWGTGQRCLHFLESDIAEKYSPDIFIDAYKNEGTFNCKSLVKPNDIELKDYFVIVAVARAHEIIQILNDQGLEYRVDYCTSVELMNVPSELLRKTIFDKHCYNLHCETMLNHMEVGTEGGAICCCSTFITNCLGTIQDTSTADVWNNIIHKIMVLSTVNRTYSLCLKEMCPFFIGKKNDCEYELDKPYPVMREKPATVGLGFDNTCNLKCITCRKDFMIAEGNALKVNNEIADKIISEIIPSTEFLIMAGNGEVLLSPSYKKIWSDERMRNVKWFRLLTNGLLFTPKNWKELRSHTDARIMMTVSIDAATRDTYEKIRSGGKFETLVKNMEYAAKLRASGELSYLRFNFVVQNLNYKEMPLFAEWGNRLGIDEVFFTKILNWGTYTKEEFKKISMMEEDGITPKPELEEVLSLPEMQYRIVDLGTIRAHHSSVDVDYIDNYYRWELERKVPDLFKE